MGEESDRSGASLDWLGGLHADDGLLKRWDLFLSLPPAARERVWEVLGPILARHSDEDIRDHALNLAQSCDLATDQLALALQACQLLVTRASELNLDAETFGRDLLELSGDHEHGPHARDVLLRGYAEARHELRQRLARDAVLGHGKLATAVEWRIDRLLSSSQCRDLDVTVPVLTINYREGARDERATFHLSSEVLLQLKNFLNTVIADAGIAGSPAPSRADDDEA